MNYHLDYLDEINKAQYVENSGKDYLDSKECSAEVISGGIILPYQRPEEGEGISAGGGVLYEDGSWAQNSAQRIVGAEIDHGYPVNKVECQNVDKKVVYFGAYHPHWGHFLAEQVGRCWYLAQHPEEAADIWVAYVRKNDICKSPISGNYLEFLELLGIKKEHVIEVEKPTRFREIILPELSCRMGAYYKKEYKETFDVIRDAVVLDNKTYSKIYFTRLKSKEYRGTQLGEKSIEKFYRKNGFNTVAPEHLSLREQIWLLKHCKELAAISGTLPHNILFANDNIKVTIVNRDIVINPYQIQINQIRNAEVTYVDACVALLPVFAGGPYLIMMNDNVIKYAEENHMKHKKNYESMLGIHVKLAWYFLYYLDRITNYDIKKWNLDKKYGEYIMNTYGFYRDKLGYYDKRKVSLLRKCFYRLARLFE